MKRKELIAGLISFGLTDTEARLYLAGLECGSTLVAPLAKISGIPRTTTYELLDGLITKGIFESRGIGKRSYYLAVAPQYFLKDLLEKEQLIRQMIPHLEDLSEKSQNPSLAKLDINVSLPLD